MAAPLTTSFRIGIFGTMRVTFDQNVNLAVDPTNKGTFVDANGNEFNTANASITSGTTVEATIVAGGAVNPTSNGTCALASGFATLVLTPFTANAPTANNAYSLTGIVSAEFNSVLLTLTITMPVGFYYDGGDPPRVKTAAGTQYQHDGNAPSGNFSTTLVFQMISGTASTAAGTMSGGVATFLRTSDDVPSIVFANFPIVEVKIGFRSRNFRGR